MLDLLIATLASLAMGFAVALAYMFRNTYSKSFVGTLVLLPAMVQIVITMVNGNLGAGVAVMGAFSLVRFRSIPGSAREISSIFFAMALGLATGMGYLMEALLFLVVVGAASFLLNLTRFGEQKRLPTKKELKVTIPENLDYQEAFADIFDKFTKQVVLNQIKTANMGSLFELKYSLDLKEAGTEKQLLDELRCRNGNLAITCHLPVTRSEEL